MKARFLSKQKEADEGGTQQAGLCYNEGKEAAAEKKDEDGYQRKRGGKRKCLS